MGFPSGRPAAVEHSWPHRLGFVAGEISHIVQERNATLLALAFSDGLEIHHPRLVLPEGKRARASERLVGRFVRFLFLDRC